MNTYKITLSSNDAAVIEKYLRLISGSSLLLDKEFFTEWKHTFLALTSDNGLAASGIADVTVEWSEDTLWDMRDLIPYIEMIGDEATGAMLHRKIYEALVKDEEQNKPYDGDIPESITDYLTSGGGSTQGTNEPEISDADDTGDRISDDTGHSESC